MMGEGITQFSKACRTGGGFQRTDDIRPARRIKQRRNVAGGGRPREERVDITGDKGSRQYWMEDGEQIIDRNMEECNNAR